MEILETQDKSNTLFSKEFNQTYHSTYGALGESRLVFIEYGLHYIKSKKEIKIFEFGFGTGLNAILTYIENQNLDLNITYHAIEKYPLELDIIKKLKFENILNKEQLKVLNKMHSINWAEEYNISKSFIFKKINDDFISYNMVDKYDLIYFDAFSPDSQPEVWSDISFTKIYDSLNSKGILTTYSSKGVVKQNLRKAGFDVIRLKGPKGKRHVLRAEKNI